MEFQDILQEEKGQLPQQAECHHGQINRIEGIQHDKKCFEEIVLKDNKGYWKSTANVCADVSPQGQIVIDDIIAKKADSEMTTTNDDSEEVGQRDNTHTFCTQRSSYSVPATHNVKDTSQWLQMALQN